MKQVIKGIKNSLTGNMDEVSAERMKICNRCKNIKHSELFGPRCGLCGCILKYKTRSDSECPDGKW